MELHPSSCKVFNYIPAFTRVCFSLPLTSRLSNWFLIPQKLQNWCRERIFPLQRLLKPFYTTIHNYVFYQCARLVPQQLPGPVTNEGLRWKSCTWVVVKFSHLLRLNGPFNMLRDLGRLQASLYGRDLRVPLGLGLGGELLVAGFPGAPSAARDAHSSPE